MNICLVDKSMIHSGLINDSKINTFIESIRFLFILNLHIKCKYKFVFVQNVK
jgi:hypothetical protein